MCRKFWWLYRLYYLCQKVSLISRYVTQRLRYILSIFMDKPSIDFFQNAWILKAHESLLLFVKCFIQWKKGNKQFFSKICTSFVCLKRSNNKNHVMIFKSELCQNEDNFSGIFRSWKQHTRDKKCVPRPSIISKSF